MITELTDMPDQRRRRTGQLVADNEHVSRSLAAKAAFRLRACQTLDIKSDNPKLASFGRIAFSEGRSNGRIMRKPRLHQRPGLLSFRPHML